METTKVRRGEHVKYCYPILKLISEHKNNLVGFSELEKEINLMLLELGLELLINKEILKESHKKFEDRTEIAYSINPECKKRVEEAIKTTKPFIESLDELYGKPEKEKIITRHYKNTRFKKE